MATNQVNAKTEKIFLKAHFKYLYFSDKIIYLIANLFKKTDSLCASTIFEHSISKWSKGKLKCESINGQDFNDKSDLKLATSQVWSYKGKLNHKAQIDNIKGKNGNLRIIVYDKIICGWYYFYIPKESYKDIKNLRITFSTEGGPRKNKRNNKNLKYWEYQCKDFIDLANK